MQYMKVQYLYVTGIPWRRASMRARGAAISLLGYCFRVENDGRIADAALWGRRDWLAAADCTRSDVDAAVSAELARWDGDDLVVDGYDHRGQAVLNIRRDQGAHGVMGAAHGEKGGRPKKQKQEEESLAETPIRGLGDNPHKGVSGNSPIPIHPTPYQSNPQPPSPSAPGDNTTTGDDGVGQESADPIPENPLSRKAQGVSVAALRLAINTGNALAVLQVFGCLIDNKLAAEWTRDTDGITIGEIAAILAWRRAAKQPIRMPSGFRAALLAWRELNIESRKRLAAVHLADLGIEHGIKPTPDHQLAEAQC